MKTKQCCFTLFKENLKAARQRWNTAVDIQNIKLLRIFTEQFKFRISAGDLLLIQHGWYVTHSGLLRLARRRRCKGITVEPVNEFSAPASQRFAFKATVHTSSSTVGFVGYGDADPSNVSPLVSGSELRIAETRAVNRALRKAYGIGICSVEEIGSFEKQQQPERPVRKLPPESSNGSNGHGGNGNGTRVRDRLIQLIRQHKLDAELVKSYAVDFCGTKTLREASREQVEAFVLHLADWAAKDRNALLCQLNSYQPGKEQAAAPQQQAGAA
jgi:hypothetical protein